MSHPSNFPVAKSERHPGFLFRWLAGHSLSGMIYEEGVWLQLSDQYPLSALLDFGMGVRVVLV